MIISVGDDRNDRTARAIGDDEVAVLEFVYLTVGGVAPLGENLHELAALYNLDAFVHKLHRASLAVGLDSAKKFHSHAQKGIAEGVLPRDGGQPARKDDEAVKNVVK